MDIAAISVLNSMIKTHQQVDLSVMKMAMDNAKQNSSNMLKIMNSSDMAQIEHSVTPKVGGNVDVKV